VTPLKVALKETPISGANVIINCVKDDKKVAKKDDKKVAKKDDKKVAKKDDKKVAKKDDKKVAFYICVFLDTKKRKSGSLFICILY
jgi:hypothetical protein